MRKAYILMGVATASWGMAGGAHAQNLTTQVGNVELWARITASVQGAAFEDPFDPVSGTRSDANADASARLNAEYVARNGWVWGARFEIDTDNRQVEALKTDEIYGYVSSELGRLELGEQDGAADVMAFHAPLVGLGQIRGDFARYVGGQALLSARDTSDAFKVVYLSPPVRGLRVGVSYAPRFGINRNAANPRARTIQRDAIEVGAQFVQPLGDWILGVSGAYVTGNSDPVTQRQDLNSYSVGVEARRGKLVLGASFVDNGSSNSLVRGLNQREFNAGAAWRDQRWGAAISGAVSRTVTTDRSLAGAGGYVFITDWLVARADLVWIRETRANGLSDSGFVTLGEIEVRY